MSGVLGNLDNPPMDGDGRFANRQGNLAVSMQAAIMCVGPLSNAVFDEFDAYWRELHRWLKQDDGSPERRRVLLSVCQGQQYNEARPDPAAMYKLLQKVWSSQPA